ncbi:hypothetical protein GLOTRDRAFT_46844, partial [Gloeophyllum trabeum ATCC 11539]
RSKAVWGDDANAFKPQRWIKDAPPAKAGVAVAPSMNQSSMTFLSGPRACIGWRFAMIEMQFIVVSLVNHFEFQVEKSVPEGGNAATFPLVDGEDDKGPQLPLRISLVQC